MSRILSGAASAAALILAGAASAASTATPPAPPVLAKTLPAGVQVIRQFPAASGLTGWVVGRDGQYSLVYTTADEKTLVAGTLVDASGRNLNEQYAQQYAPGPDHGAAFKKIDGTTSVAEGATAPKSVLHVFVDANCPYCHLLWIALQPYEAAGLQVRWHPIAVLGPTSLPKALEVLAAGDRPAAFRRMENAHGKPWTAPAGISEQARPELAAQVKANNALMAQFGLNGTPGVVWRDAHGSVHARAGLPPLGDLAAMTGLPEQPQTDPALARFR
jgi:thiol:disulfide interchange protein DsbG